ncbi:MAG: alginate lyase family protein [Pirellulales bacterium]
MRSVVSSCGVVATSLAATSLAAVAACCILDAAPSAAAERGVHATVYHAARAGSLEEAKRRIAAGDQTLEKVLERLVKTADGMLDETPPTVTAKSRPAPSGDRHDYTSLAPYFWPDPKKPNGLPYVRRDGERNPEAGDDASSDRGRLSRLGFSIETLALAWYFTGRREFADHAAAFARAWFVDPRTRMNPHLQFAQAVRGANEGRGEGILEGRYVADAIDAISLIADSGALTAEDRRAIDAWATSYIEWLTTSGHGRHEQAADNNHGTYYDVQLAQLALATGRRDVADTVLREAAARRIAVQIEPDGSQPRELKRTRSLGYSQFNLHGMCKLATLGEHVGVDLWQATTADGRSIRKAIDHLMPFVSAEGDPWPHPQIADVDPRSFATVLWRASVVYDDPRYAAEIRGFPEQDERVKFLFVAD